MNIQVKWNGADITNSIIEYSREHDICTGVGTLDLNVEAKTAIGFDPWDTIEIYENGELVHIYNIASTEEQIPGLLYVASCQDDSKRLTDYFIDQMYTINYPSTARYWIELFLDMAGVTYNFNVSGSGNSLSENTTLGATSAYDAIINLLQLCGWYFYFDANNVCQIGKLTIEGNSPKVTFTGNEITDIGYSKNDKMLRNRAIVWGAGDPDTHEWIYADTSTMTPWNRPGNDYRTIVYANGLIKTWGIAYSLAFLILNEFSKIVPEKKIVIAGSNNNVTLGSYIRGTTNLMMVEGMVTHIVVNMSEQGLTSTYTLDQRCPRLFGYANWNDYVYIGTQGNGVWRKYLTSPTWNNYSTGITKLNITDLSASDGLLGAISMIVTSSGSGGSGITNPTIDSQLYVRHTSLGSWSAYNPGSFMDYSGSGIAKELSSGIIAEACSIDRTYGVAGLITAGFTIPGSGKFIGSGEYYTPSGNLSWVQGITTSRVPIYTQQVHITGSGNYKIDHPFEAAIVDLDTNWDGINIISIFNGRNEINKLPTISGISTRPYDFGDIMDLGHDHNGIPGLGFLPWSEGGSSPTIKVMVPPTTSGIVLETFKEVSSGIYNNGYKQFGVTIASRSTNLILEDNVDTDSKAYGWGLDEIGYYLEKYAFIIASGTWSASGILLDWYTHKKYYMDIPTDTLEAQLCSVGKLYKISENHFTLSVFSDSRYMGEEYFPISFLHADLILSDLDDSMSLGGFSRTIISENYIIEPNAGCGWAGPEGHGRYTGIITSYESKETPKEFSVGFAVGDKVTGSVSTEILSNIYYDGTCIGGIAYDGWAPNHQLFNVSTAEPIIEGEDWGGIHSFIISLNVNTGDYSVNIINFDPGGPGVLKSSTTFWTGPLIFESYTDGYKSAGMSTACENPDTGNGIGHLAIWYSLNRREFPLSGDLYVINCLLHVVMNTNGGGGSANVYNDVFTNGYLTDAGVPTWARGNGYLTFVPTCSRNFDTTPGIYSIGSQYDGSKHIVLAGPGDFETVAEFETVNLKDYGGSDIELKPWWACPMIDDGDNTLYTLVGKADATLSGWNNLTTTVGYNLGGTATKILFPDGVHGTPLHDKILVSEHGDSSTIYIYLPMFTEPARSSLEDSYLILKHNPNPLPASGVFPASGTFDIIYKSHTPMYVDTSKSIPTIIYNKSKNDQDWGNIYRSFTNESGSFKGAYPYSPVYDVRSFDASGSLAFFPASGNSMPSGFLDRYIGIAAGYKGLIMYSSELGPYTLLHSGAFTHLDFTNNFPDPYMFTSTSGTGTTASGRFLQRDTESVIWNDYSSTLPSGMITIIRADDRM